MVIKRVWVGRRCITAHAYRAKDSGLSPSMTAFSIIAMLILIWLVGGWMDGWMDG